VAQPARIAFDTNRPNLLDVENGILERIGLVIHIEQGNLALYRANTKNIIHEDLKRIFMKYVLVDNRIAKDLPASEIKYALIYGSFAKGTERESSDIDLLVIGQISDDHLLDGIMKAQKEIGREINYIL
jgi:predicted nucleotidyltransferase